MTRLCTATAPCLDIIEIIGFADQGRSLPIRCKAEDGELYFVKGHQTNRSSLWAEWICGHAAKALGLPIPDFALVQIDHRLLKEVDPALRVVGSAPAFASRLEPHTTWFELSAAAQVPDPLKRDIILFDWWVMNTDRLRGNTNMLWNALSERLVIIDHNLAFDPQFDSQKFELEHVFGDIWEDLLTDWLISVDHEDRLRQTLPAVAKALETAPEEWLWENPEMDVPANFDPSAAQMMLAGRTSLL